MRSQMHTRIRLKFQKDIVFEMVLSFPKRLVCLPIFLFCRRPMPISGKEIFPDRDFVAITIESFPLKSRREFEFNSLSTFATCTRRPVTSWNKIMLDVMFSVCFS